MHFSSGSLQVEKSAGFLKWNNLFPLLMFLAIALMVDHYQDHQIEYNNQEHLRSLSQHFSSDMEHLLSEHLFLIHGLAAFIQARPHLSELEFKHFAEALSQQTRIISSLQWAPAGIIRYIHPQQGNEAVQEMNLLEDPVHRDVVIQGIAENLYVISGPVPLRQGGFGLIARLPLYQAGHPPSATSFTGLVSIVMHMDEIYAATRLSSHESQLEIALRGQDGKGMLGEIFHGNAELFSVPDAVLSNIQLPEGSWQMASRLRDPQLRDWADRLPIFLLALFAMLPVLYLDRRLTRTRQQLTHTQEQLQSTEQRAKMGGWVKYADSDLLQWTPEVFRIFEMEPRAGGVDFNDFLAAIHPDDRERLSTTYFTAVHEKKNYDMTHRLLLANGRIKHVREYCRNYYDKNGNFIYSNGMVEDITESFVIQQALQESELRYRMITSHTYGWEYWLGNQGEILYMSKACERISGYPVSEFVARPQLLEDIILPEDREIFLTHKRRYKHDPHIILEQINFRIQTRDGDCRWIAHGCRGVFSDTGEPLGIRASNRDITDLKQAKRQKKSFALLFVDLDRFKEINDTFGHDMGDVLLTEVASRFRYSIRESDTVARTGGDEFIILLHAIASEEDARHITEQIFQSLAEPVRIGHQWLSIQASIGVAVFHPDSKENTDMLLKRADDAMYAAKRAGRNTWHLSKAMPQPEATGKV